ncbi:hypothetical protein [Nannocystis radixulma]|uniref:Uncharacterized protein n=1 Tax=Nannocystis radixulma TaxID=2995305 RepID=A0ABT5BQ51_9BACT|nr:hypothetical protein [Nannocystis radixulma]MDC0675533.1 hypothetical protein [Nannocystis radixulma]
MCAIALVTAGCREVVVGLPPTIASSKYLEFHTDVDASVICMDDFLAREDAFIERTAMLLGVEPPSRTIHYVWDPSPDQSEWPCPPLADCYVEASNAELSAVMSRHVRHHHELVHAVEILALGDGHVGLKEGVAEYLGSLDHTLLLPDDFPAAVKEALAAPGPDDYMLAMQFVGWIFEHHGADKYRALRAKMPVDAKLEVFAEVFAAEFGRPFDDALEEMQDEVIYGQDVFAGCTEGEVRELEWTAAELLETTVDGECGDPWFYGTGFVAGRPGFTGVYAVEVPEAGRYALTVGAAGDGPTPVHGLLGACSFELLGSGVGSFGGQRGEGVLQAGRHVLGVGYPQGPEARGAATVKLEYLGPPP